MNRLSVPLSSLASEPTLRCDVDYIQYQNCHTSSTSYSFNELFELVPHTKKPCEADLENDFDYCQIGDVSNDGIPNPVNLSMSNQSPEYDSYYKKISKGDIFTPTKDNFLLSKVRPYLNKTVFLNNGFEKIYYTKAFIEIKAKTEPLIMYYSLRSIFLNNIVIISRQGKGYPTLNENDFKYLKFEKAAIDRLFSKSKELNKIINESNETIIKNISQRIPWHILNNNFSSKLWNYSNNLFFEYGKGMCHPSQKSSPRKIRLRTIGLNDIANSRILRCSERYHNKVSTELTTLLNGYKTIPLGNILISCEKGLQPDYDELGTIKVIKIANMKDESFNFDECEYISADTYSKIPENKKVKKNDIILCVTGKCSLGKACVVNFDEDTISAADNYVLRIDTNKYNPYYLTLFLRSILGLFQIERDYTGCTNQIHLYEEEIRKFKIPDTPLEEQNKVVESFLQLIAEQNAISTSINKAIKTITSSLA